MTKTKKPKTPLFLPALHGEMGDWSYYSTLMTTLDVATRVDFGGEVHKSKRLSEMIQRFLKGKRAKQIALYLKDQKQRFFSSLVIGIYGGEPGWHAMQLKNADSSTISVGDVPVEAAFSFGVLGLSGKEELFALDGQHRLAGLQYAQEKRWLNEQEQLSVIFVAHRKTADGLARTRRLFTTLNKTAKPVSKAERIILDQDDPAAVCTRHLIDNFFREDAIRIKGGDSLPREDRQSFTAIIGLYDALRAFVPERAGEQRRGFANRVFDEGKLRRFCQISEELFAWLGEALPETTAFWNGTKSAMRTAVGKHRRVDGGHLLFRPVGLVLFVEAAAQMWGRKMTAGRFRRALTELPMAFEAPPFAGLLWDTQARRVESRNKKAAQAVVRYMLGDNASKTTARLQKATLEALSTLPRLGSKPGRNVA